MQKLECGIMTTKSMGKRIWYVILFTISNVGVDLSRGNGMMQTCAEVWKDWQSLSGSVSWRRVSWQTSSSQGSSHIDSWKGWIINWSWLLTNSRDQEGCDNNGDNEKTDQVSSWHFAEIVQFIIVNNIVGGCSGNHWHVENRPLTGWDQHGVHT